MAENTNYKPRSHEEKYEGNLEYSTLISNRLNDLKKEIKVMLPCKVTKVNHNTNYVTVELLDYDSDEKGNTQEYPPLTNVPIRQPMDSGSAFIRLPVQVGDTGTIQFFDSSVDDLITSGTHTYDYTEDWHKLSDNLFTNGFLPNNKLFTYAQKNTALVSKSNNPTMIVEPTDELWDREIVYNSDGSYSTSVSITVGIDDNLVVIPTCYDGSIHSEEDSIQHYLQTGKHFGIFNSSNPTAVEAYATNLHNAQDIYANSPLKSSDKILIGTKDGNFTFTVNSNNQLVITAPSIGIKAEQVFIDGNVIANGNITATGTITGTTDVIGGGKSLKSHTHPYTDNGNSMNTGSPN